MGSALHNTWFTPELSNQGRNYNVTIQFVELQITKSFKYFSKIKNVFIKKVVDIERKLMNDNEIFCQTKSEHLLNQKVKPN